MCNLIQTWSLTLYLMFRSSVSSYCMDLSSLSICTSGQSSRDKSIDDTKLTQNGSTLQHIQWGASGAHSRDVRLHSAGKRSGLHNVHLEFGFSPRLQSAAPDSLFDFWKHRRTDCKYLCEALHIKHATLKTNAFTTWRQCSPVSAVAVPTVVKCFIHHECYVSVPSLCFPRIFFSYTYMSEMQISDFIIG